MAGVIYGIRGDGELVEMKVSDYDSEELLQALLAKYPKLLAGDQIDESAPRRFLLVEREVGVPAEKEGGARWALDHLFVDQEGIPTFVEVKRSSDTRLRREVVGQMLDYAANAVVHWPPEAIRSSFENTCRARSVDPGVELERFLEPDQDPEEFWQSVKTNLQAGRVRLLIVADEIPPELRRVVEFLNGQMDPAEILAVEVKQYAGPDLRAMVPRVVGQTAAADSRKEPARRRWDEESFFKDAEQRLTAPQLAAVRRLYESSKGWAERIAWGTGSDTGSFNPKHSRVSARSPYTVWSNGELTISFKWLDDNPDFAKRLGQALVAEGVLKLPRGYVDEYISFKPDVWTPVVDKFAAVISRMVKEA